MRCIFLFGILFVILSLVYYSWCIVFLVIIFFFKQKTAYEMRISDWSSDVCSSDLELYWRLDFIAGALTYAMADFGLIKRPGNVGEKTHCQRSAQALIRFAAARSEEHTSELQSLMRISYAVFCLKKKTNKLHTEIISTYTIHSSHRINTRRPQVRID